MYAIIQSGGKQYRAVIGERLRLEKLEIEEGKTVEFDVLMLGGEKTVVGAPTVKGAKVVAEIKEHGKHKKIIVAKFKAKVKYRRKNGHRQPFTDIVVTAINA
jgi:large subunit ribosomal protein L21